MKKIGLVIVSVLLIITMIGCQGNNGGSNEPDFKDVRWGMTKQEVIDVEINEGNVNYREVHSLSEVIEYKDLYINGIEAKVWYIFEDDDAFGDKIPRLKRGEYHLDTRQTDGLIKTLNDKYGEHTIVTEDPLLVKWNTPRTEILLSYRIIDHPALEREEYVVISYHASTKHLERLDTKQRYEEQEKKDESISNNKL